MPAGATAMTLTTDRLILRPQREQDAAVFHRLWGERDERVPPHRRLDAHGHPTVADIADDIRQQQDAVRPGLLTVVLQESGETIGYCGVVWDADGVRPELAFELLGAMHNREARLHRDRGGHEGRPARTLSDDHAGDWSLISVFSPWRRCAWRRSMTSANSDPHWSAPTKRLSEVG